MPSTDKVALQEGVLSNIIDAVKKAQEFKSAYNSSLARRKAKNYLSTTSIARIARDLTMSFPTICSDAIDGNTACMLNKAIERKNVTLIQMVVASMHPQGRNGQDIVNQLHTNMGVNYNLDDYIDGILAFKDTIFGENFIPLTGQLAVIAEEARKEFLDSLNHRYPLNSISEYAISDYYIMDAYGTPKVFREDSKNNIREREFEYRKQKDERDDTYKRNRDFYSDMQKSNDFAYKTSRDATLDAQKKADYDYRKSNDDRNYEYRKSKDEEDRKYRQSRDAELDAQKRADDEYRRSNDNRNYNYRKSSDDRNYNYRQSRDAAIDAQKRAENKYNYLSKQLLDSDVKKANELQPTMIMINYQVADRDKDSSEVNNYISDTFIAGVKSRLISVHSADILERIKFMGKGGADMKNLIRATTKETSFSKDFLSAIQQAKIDAKKDSKLYKSNGIWRSLAARSARSKINRLIRMQNGSAAITTLVMTVQEVEIAKEQYGIDLLNPGNAIKFMDAYNLLALVIVDEQTETAHFIYDGDAYYEVLAFSTLQKENDRSYKQVIDLLNKTR